MYNSNMCVCADDIILSFLSNYNSLNCMLKLCESPFILVYKSYVYG